MSRVLFSNLSITSTGRILFYYSVIARYLCYHLRTCLCSVDLFRTNRFFFSFFFSLVTLKIVLLRRSIDIVAISAFLTVFLVLLGRLVRMVFCMGPSKRNLVTEIQLFVRVAGYLPRIRTQPRTSPCNIH